MPAPAASGQILWRLNAPEATLERAEALLEAEGFRVKRSARSIAATASTWQRLGAMLRQLFRDAGTESAGRRVTEPLLTGLLAALAVVGLFVSLRRPDPVWRVLAIWFVGAALLPGTIGTPFPRRSVLIFPAAQALMALPLLELAAGRSRSNAARRAWAAAAVVLAAWIVAGGADGYFHRWYVQQPPPEASLPASSAAEPTREKASRDGFLELAKLIRQLPPDEPVLVAPFYTGLAAIYRQLEAPGGPDAEPRVRVATRATTRAAVLGLSCRTRIPFTWVSGDYPEQRRLFRILKERFSLEEEIRQPYRVLRVVGRSRGACPEPGTEPQR